MFYFALGMKDHGYMSYSEVERDVYGELLQVRSYWVMKVFILHLFSILPLHRYKWVSSNRLKISTMQPPVDVAKSCNYFELLQSTDVDSPAMYSGFVVSQIARVYLSRPPETHDLKEKHESGPRGACFVLTVFQQ